MKKVWFDNEAIIELLFENGVSVYCGEYGELYTSDEEAARIPAILEENDVDNDLYGIEE